MSYIRKRLKSVAEILPEPLGRLVVAVPYSWRLGRKYTETRREIEEFSTLQKEEQREYIFQRIRGIVEHAYDNIRFYRSHYEEYNFSPEALKDFDDIQQIPIVTKDDLRQWRLEERSHVETDQVKMNTGGTSGSPLHFYLDRNAFAREWAHMHNIWESLGYQRTDRKLTIRGANVGDRPYKYNAVHNEYIINTYKPFKDTESSILELAKEKDIKYIHGYPSAIYEFARYCQRSAPKLVNELSSTLRGVLLGSEYPAPVYRETIDEVFDGQSLSWYGHSEMAVFAPERSSEYVYEPMHTYGYSEAVPGEEGEHRLLGTSYYNTASPFIRYDTGDRVGKVDMEDGILQAFEITAGRVGEFITDQSGHRISLTGLIFGRHHEIFEYAQFVQVRQDEPGRATIVVTPSSEIARVGAIEWYELFDDTNVDIDINVEVVDSPVRSPQGKVKLLV